METNIDHLKDLLKEADPYVRGFKCSATPPRTLEQASVLPGDIADATADAADHGDTLLNPYGKVFAMSFQKGLPSTSGPCLFVVKDGSVHAGEIVWTDNALALSGKSQVLRTTNAAGGLHTVFDIPADQVIGYAQASARWLRTDWPD